MLGSQPCSTSESQPALPAEHRVRVRDREEPGAGPGAGCDRGVCASRLANTCSW